MTLSARLRSWMALPVVAVLLGTPALPLAVCAFEDGQSHCAGRMPREVVPAHGCSKSDGPTPPAISCCCHRDAASLPLDRATTTEIASPTLSFAVSPVEPVAVEDGLTAAVETTAVLTRHRPLFTLFSAFLI